MKTCWFVVIVLLSIAVVSACSSEATETPGQATESGLGIGSTLISDVDGMLMVYVPEGEFVMGSEDGDENEQPVHTVFLEPYWIDSTEVTNDQYRQCVESGTCFKPPTDDYLKVALKDHPVVRVSWEMALDYCGWAGRRLPSEAEWEKAARGTDGRIYPWGDEEAEKGMANFHYIVGDTSEVGHYPTYASPYGAFDMAGNVMEWVMDWYGADYYTQSPASSPGGPNSGQQRVQRGGGWYSQDYYLRTSARSYFDPANVTNALGFRCAMTP